LKENPRRIAPKDLLIGHIIRRYLPVLINRQVVASPPVAGFLHTHRILDDLV
jgi:hypothetical protein